MADLVPNVITRYFAAQANRDFDALVKLFTEDGQVIDEGKTWSGAAQIREWRDTVASFFQYTTEVRDVRATGKHEYTAKVHLEGNFPGGVVDLDYRFSLEGDLISRLQVD